jgi:hypothetical protein
MHPRRDAQGLLQGSYNHIDLQLRFVNFKEYVVHIFI